MHRSFRQTDHSKLFFIRMGLIFPVCLIYIPVTRTLFREILMKKEEEELILAEYQPKHSWFSCLQGMEWLCREVTKRFVLWEAFFSYFLVPATYTGCCREKTRPKPCLFPTLLPPFLAYSWRNLDSPCSSWSSCILCTTLWLGGSPHASFSRPPCIQSVPQHSKCCWGHPASKTQQLYLGPNHSPSSIWCFCGPFPSLFLFLLIYWESGFGSIGNTLYMYGAKNLLLV